MESDLNNNREYKSYLPFRYGTSTNPNDLINCKACDNFTDDHILYFGDTTVHITNSLIRFDSDPHQNHTEYDKDGVENLYIILDLDNHEYIKKTKEAIDSDFVHELKGGLGCCVTKPFFEKQNTIKLEDFYKDFKTFNDCIHKDIDYDLNTFEEKLEPNNFKNETSDESESFIKSENYNIHIISDDEFQDDVISVSSDEDAAIDFKLNYISNEITPEPNDHFKTAEISQDSNSETIKNLNVTHDTDYKIPKDTDYIKMFETNIPYPTRMKHKSSYKDFSMNVEFEDLGFNLNFFAEDNLKEHIKNEAKESKRMILSMYPLEN